MLASRSFYAEFLLVGDVSFHRVPVGVDLSVPSVLHLKLCALRPGAWRPERGGEQSQNRRGGEDLFALLRLSFQTPAARCLQTARWGAGEVATLSGGTSWYLDAPQQSLWHQPEPFTPKPAMPRRVIGIPEALCLVNPGFLRSEHVTTGGKQRTVLENGRFLKHVPGTASFAGE